MMLVIVEMVVSREIGEFHHGIGAEYIPWIDSTSRLLHYLVAKTGKKETISVQK